MRRSWRVLIWALLSIALIALGLYLKRQLEIDDCLDSGGRWNYETATCEGAFK